MSQKENFLETSSKELVILFDNKSFENCVYGCEPITKKNGWKAPEGKAFKITGQFELEKELKPNDDIQWGVKLSFDKLTTEHPNEYKKFLDETLGDEKSAIQLLIEYFEYDEFMYAENEIPPSFFIGKWLMFNHNYKNQEISISINQINSWFKYEEDICEIEDIDPRSTFRTPCMWIQKHKRFSWQRDSASAILNKCKIELIDFLEEKNLYVPKPEDINPDKEILIPSKGEEITEMVVGGLYLRPESQKKLPSEFQDKKIVIVKRMEDIPAFLRKNK